MRLQEFFTLVRSSEKYQLPYDFFISTYPLAVTGSGDVKFGDSSDSRLHRTTWEDATEFCNRLSRANNLLQTYGNDPWVFDTAPNVENLTRPSFRLPTATEWEHAAHGWSGRRTGDYFPIMKQNFKVPFQDCPITGEQKRQYDEGYATIAELNPNHIGIYGMLVYAREWCTAFAVERTPERLAVRWEEYVTNYDNDIGYQTTPFDARADEVLPFRVVFPCAVMSVTGTHSQSSN
jgi:formylglycine-generating enzyme required for sulfatase activity